MAVRLEAAIPMAWWQWLALIFGSLLALPLVLMYIVAPLVAWRTSRICREPRFTIDSAADAGLDLESRQFVDEAGRVLASLGFTPRFDADTAWRQSNAQERQSLHTWPYLNPGGDTAALIWIVRSSLARQTLVQRQVEFVTSLGAERNFTTTNADLPPSLSRRPNAPLIVFTGLADLDHLYTLHRGVLERDYADDVRAFEDPDPIANLVRATIRDLEHGIAAGTYRKIGETHLGLSLKSAWQATLDMLWPRRGRHLAAISARRAQLEAEFDIGPPDAPAPRSTVDGRDVYGLHDPHYRPAWPGMTIFGAFRQLVVVRGIRSVVRAGPDRQEIHVGEDDLLLPGGVRLDLDQVLEVSLIDTGPYQQTVVVRGLDERRAHVRADLPARLFVDDERGAEALVDELRQRIQRRDPGQALTLQRLTRWRLRILASGSPVTKALLILATIGFLAQTGLSNAPDDLVPFVGGALVPDLALSGQSFRLFLANFFYLGWPHFLIVALLLALVGSMIERTLGSLAFTTLAVVGGSAGLSALLLHTGGWQTYGGSALLAALAGGGTVLMFHLPPHLGVGATARGNRIGASIVVVLCVAISVFEWWAFRSFLHIAALLVGALIVAVLRGARDYDEACGRSATMIGSLALAGATTAVIFAAVRLLDPPRAFVRDIQLLTLQSDPDCWSINDLAYRATANPGTFRDRTADHTVAATLRCLDLLGRDNPHALQSIAEVMHNVGRSGEAIAYLADGLSLFERHDDHHENASLAVRLIEMVKATGGPVTLGDASFSAPQLTIDKQGLLVTSPAPATLYAASSPPGDDDTGMVVRIEAAAGPTRIKHPPAPESWSLLVIDTRTNRRIANETIHVLTHD